MSQNSLYREEEARKRWEARDKEQRRKVFEQLKQEFEG